jgi:predicted pyridoxine 5'-phosphate oxidase superfamily flavin-nucleotide-binding protein
MTTSLPPMTRRLLDLSTYAALATVNGDGSPQSSVVWVRRDGDELLIDDPRAA